MGNETEYDVFSRFNHWLSVFVSRLHELSHDDWLDCRNPYIELSMSEENLSWNKEYLKPTSSVLLPIIDMINHMHPQEVNMSDMVSFNFEIYGLEKHPLSDDRKIGITALTHY